MKKTYINPVTEVVTIHAAQLLAGSPGLDGNNPVKPGDPQLAPGQYDDWDDEEDEEETSPWKR